MFYSGAYFWTISWWCNFVANLNVLTLLPLSLRFPFCLENNNKKNWGWLFFLPWKERLQSIVVACAVYQCKFLLLRASDDVLRDDIFLFFFWLNILYYIKINLINNCFLFFLGSSTALVISLLVYSIDLFLVWLLVFISVSAAALTISFHFFFLLHCLFVR